MIEKVQTNRESFTLIESVVSSGQGFICILTLATGKFWASDADLGGLTEEDYSVDEEEDEMDAELRGINFDEVDLMRGRMILDNILKSMGEEPCFLN